MICAKDGVQGDAVRSPYCTLLAAVKSDGFTTDQGIHSKEGALVSPRLSTISYIKDLYLYKITCITII